MSSFDPAYADLFDAYLSLVRAQAKLENLVDGYRDAGKPAQAAAAAMELDRVEEVLKGLRNLAT